MASVLPFDELNRFNEDLRKRYGTEKLKVDDLDEILDEMLDLFLLAFAQGNMVTQENLAYLAQNKEFPKPTINEVMEVVSAKVAGKTWEERTKDYFANGGSVDDIVRIAETETHRIANTSALSTAKKIGAKSKTWSTMLDDRVRDTHDYLESMTVGIDEDFVTYDGDSASAPGLFQLPQNNISCRCELIFS